MTLESQRALLKIMASNSVIATPSSTSITRVINLPLLSKADLSSAFRIVHDSQQGYWCLKNCFWSKYCSTATSNKTLIPIRPSSFPAIDLDLHSSILRCFFDFFWISFYRISKVLHSPSQISNIQVMFCQVAMRRPKCSHPVTCTPHVRTSMPNR